MIAPDFPGYGKSCAEPPVSSIEGIANRVIELADSLGVQQFAVVGHSMGGFIAQQLMCKWPHRITRAVLYGTALKIDPAKRFESSEQTIARLKSEGVSKAVDYVTATWFTKGRDDPAYEFCRRAADAMTLEAGIAAFVASGAVDFEEAMKQVATKALIIIGDKEKTFPPEMGLQLRAALRNSTLCVLPGCGHAAHLEKPHLFNQIVMDFLCEN